MLLSEELAPLYFKLCSFVRMSYVTTAKKPQSRKQETWGTAEGRGHQMAQLVASKAAGVKKWPRGWEVGHKRCPPLGLLTVPIKSNQSYNLKL